MTGPGHVSRRLRREVMRRAGYVCEYCRSQQDLCPELFQVDHIVPKSVGGPTTLTNLCLACPVCNNAKRSAVSAPDPLSRQQVPLYDPRRQRWDRHFQWSIDSTTLMGLTPSGRATVVALRMNRPRMVRIRRYWTKLGLHPPAL
jgi:hypothetical protein